MSNPKINLKKEKELFIEELKKIPVDEIVNTEPEKKSLSIWQKVKKVLGF